MRRKCVMSSFEEQEERGAQDLSRVGHNVTKQVSSFPLASVKQAKAAGAGVEVGSTKPYTYIALANREREREKEMWTHQRDRQRESIVSNNNNI